MPSKKKTNYKAVARLKLDDNEYIERGEDVDVSDLEEEHVNQLVADKVILEADAFDAMFTEPNEGANQAWGTPSNLDKIEGTDLQMNPPENDPEDEAPDVRDAPANPADVQPVEGAATPGDGTDAVGQDHKEDS